MFTAVHSACCSLMYAVMAVWMFNCFTGSSMRSLMSLMVKEMGAAALEIDDTQLEKLPV